MTGYVCPTCGPWQFCHEKKADFLDVVVSLCCISLPQSAGSVSAPVYAPAVPAGAEACTATNRQGQPTKLLRTRAGATILPVVSAAPQRSSSELRNIRQGALGCLHFASPRLVRHVPGSRPRIRNPCLFSHVTLLVITRSSTPRRLSP